MRTLDEVIKANECCDHGELDSRCEDCPYSGIGACLLERETDALHYLREYKERKNALRYWSEKAISEQQNFADAYMFYKSENEKDNNPLTWEELESMEGKPVWVEGKGLGGADISNIGGFWAVISHFCVDSNGDVSVRFTDGSAHYLEDFNHMPSHVFWQAYRKERHEDARRSDYGF